MIPYIDGFTVFIVFTLGFWGAFFLILGWRTHDGE